MKNNRSSSLSVMIAAFISALLLSLLCGLFYNAWKYEVERIEQEEGGWHSRILGEPAERDMETAKNFANVRDAVANPLALDLYFEDLGAVFTDTPRIAEQIGAAPEQIVYHYGLLAMYLVRDSSDTAPRLLFPMFLLILFLAAFSLIVIIHNAFAVSMNARIYQFGIFSSIGATPKQIRTCLLQEAAALCAVPVLLGNLAGIAGSMGLLNVVLIYDSYGIPRRPSRTDITVHEVNAMEATFAMGNSKTYNMVVLGALLGIKELVPMEAVVKGLKKTLPERHHHLIPLNEAAIERGMALVKG